MERMWGGLRGEATMKSRSATLTKQPPPQGSVSKAGAAAAGAVRSHAPLAVARTSSKISVTSKTFSPQPYSQTEQYWAARALSAETLLSAKAAHHNEVREILLAAENKRMKELYLLAREHNARHSRLEKLVVGLLLSLLTFVLYVIYVLTPSYYRHPRDTSRLSTLLPNHFTIPILSPFTSVVESETAVIGARTVAMFIIVTGAVVYGILKRRMIFGRPAP